MKLADAKPGDTLRDKDGSLWVCYESGWMCMFDTADPPRPDGSATLSSWYVERFGPFTRLVPEKTNDND